VEKVHSGRYGKRIPVSKKSRPTSEAMEKVNFRRKVAKLRRLIANNFTDEDWHVTLTYKKQSRPDLKQAKAYLGKFHAKMKRRYAKAGVELKTMAQTAVAMLPSAAMITDVNWLTVIGTAALVGVASVLTSVAGLPEVKETGKK